MRTIARTLFALLASLALLPLGCSGGTGTVSGKVYFNDQPLPWAPSSSRTPTARAIKPPTSSRTALTRSRGCRPGWPRSRS